MRRFDFPGATALVTGAAGGIGEQLARGLADRGTDLELVDVPVRIDSGIFDVVVPITSAEQLAATYRAKGVDLTYQRWFSGHSPVTDNGVAAGPAAEWIASLLRE